MNKFKYPFVIYPADEGGYVAEIPSLRGCLAQGETLAETLEELLIVADLWLETARKNGEALPNEEREYERIKRKLAA